MKGIFLFLLLFTAITYRVSAQDITHSTQNQTLIIHLKPVADMKLVKNATSTSVQLHANKDMMLNVNTDKSNASDDLSVKASEGEYVSLSTDPANLLSNYSRNDIPENLFAINYLAGQDPRTSVNVIFTLTNR